MVDSGEDSMQAATREFLEEMMDAEKLGLNDVKDLRKVVDKVLSCGKIVSYLQLNRRLV